MSETKQITKAIIQVMQKVEGIDKSMTVGEGRNSYKGVSDKDVRLKIGLAMRECGLCIVPTAISPNIRVDRWEEESTWNGKTQMKQKQSIFTEVETKYLLLHESGESIELSGYGHGVDTQDKGAGKATTYALKNTLLATFLVPTGVEDTDNTHSDDLPVPQKQIDPNLRTQTQVDTIKKMMIETRTSLEAMREFAGITEGEELTKQQAAKVIKWQNELIDDRGEVN